MTPADLTEYRETLGFNKLQMAELLGVSGPAISLWESGKNPMPRILVKLVAVLKSLDFMLGRPDKAEGVPRGFCQCGCGQATAVNTRNQTAKGWIRGEHRAFISGHNIKAEKRA